MHLNDHIEDLATKLAGNHRKFESFAWSGRPEDDLDWAIVYTSNRDSGLTDESNESVINATLEPFSKGDDPDVVFERHSHFLVGYVDGFSIRVRKNGELTEAFRKYAELKITLNNSPFLDDGDYSEREYNAALKAIEGNAPNLIREPKGWADKVFGWLYDNEQDEVENRDDQGASPSEASICRAVEALKIGYVCPGCDVVIQAGMPTANHRNECKWIRNWYKD